MSNFDFLKNFNKELYEIGRKLEEDVIESPRAVTADATLFLETLVKDIYKLSNKKLDKNLISFYKKTDNLYRLGVITYIYKNKLQDAYTLRNKIHNSVLNVEEEENLAFDLHKRLFYISKKYFQDYCDNERYITIPDYTKPDFQIINFEKCIICGSNDVVSNSNMCGNCNKRIDNANFLLNINNIFESNKFSRQDLTKLGISESESISFLMELSKENVILKKGDTYTFNEDKFNQYIEEIDQYIEIGILLTKFYKDEITALEIKNTLEYWKGSIKQKPYVEFYNLVNVKLEKTFEENLIKFQNIEKSMRISSMDDFNVSEWYDKEKSAFLNGIINESFILYNEILIDEFFKLEKKGLKDIEILKQLNISQDIYQFWKNEFIGKDFAKQSISIKKDIIISEIRKNSTLDNAIKKAGILNEEFEKMLIISQNINDDFYKKYEREYVKKRQKSLLKHLKKSNLNKAIHLSKITYEEFIKWYYESENELSDFYIKTTKILMDKYLNYRKNGWSKQDILKHLDISRNMYNSWLNHDELKFVESFKQKNNKITSNLLKRGLIINNLKDGKSKNEAISASGLSYEEFQEIYDDSKKEKTNFHLRFDIAYMENRKKLFMKLIGKNDFFNAIEKSEISQTEFNKWYLQDQDKFTSRNEKTEFYMITTEELMNKYLEARKDGKNKPDAARSVGLSNIIVNKWMKHPEFDLYYEFKKKNKQLTIDLIVSGFKEGKSKMEVCERYDITPKTIENFVNLGKNGFLKYEKIYDLYENKVIPEQLEVFLENFKTKTFNKALKNAKLSKKELDYYYDLGKNEDEKFGKFYHELFDLKIQLYVDTILAKKSSKIAFKNSTLTKDEFLNNKALIDDAIFKGRISIVIDEFKTHKSNGYKISKKLGISVDEVYDWYFKGKEGDPKYKSFYLLMELNLVVPILIGYHHSLELGIPRNWLLKQIKKEIGSVDYKIWEKHNMFDKDITKIKIFEGEEAEQIIDSIKNSDLITSENQINDPLKFFESIMGNNKIKKTVITTDGSVVKKEIIGN